MQLAKAVASAAAALVLKAKSVAQRTEDSGLQTQVIAAATQCALSTSQLVACTKVSPKGGSSLCQGVMLRPLETLSFYLFGSRDLITLLSDYCGHHKHPTSRLLSLAYISYT